MNNNTLEDNVKKIVEDFVANNVLFTAKDVSDELKVSMPFARHREVRDIVRSLYADMQNSGYGRTPIEVVLSDGSKQDALLYHSLSDSWDLDTKYDAQKRDATLQNNQPVVPTVQPTTVVQAQVVQPAPVVQPTDPKQLWDNLFGSTKLFPTI